MFKHRKMRFNGEWSLLAGNRVYELRPLVPKISPDGFPYYVDSNKKTLSDKKTFEGEKMTTPKIVILRIFSNFIRDYMI
jgi:hypothetical protein